jgi:hypothetical protein
VLEFDRLGQPPRRQKGRDIHPSLSHDLGGREADLTSRLMVRFVVMIDRCAYGLFE